MDITHWRTWLPLVGALLAGALSYATASAVQQANLANVTDRVGKLERQYETVPERLGNIEGYQRSQAESLRNIQDRLDQLEK